MSDIVSIAHEGQRQPPQISEIFLQREHVGERLTRVVEVAQRIDHRNRGALRKLLDRALVEGTGDNGVHPAIHVPGYILQRLTRADAAFAEHRVATRLLDGELESDSR